MEEFFLRAKQAIPNVCMGTDLMVGYPGETEYNFEETCENFLKFPLSYCHVFTYSERDGTPAAKQTDHVPMEQRRQRSARLRRLSASKRMEFHQEYVGKQVKVLLENPKNGFYAGYTQNYLKVVVPQEPAGLQNRFARVDITEARPEYCQGKLVSWENQ
jgi:threonylcarbamoyladenosine tRNA methylthiotransferase MtaB